VTNDHQLVIPSPIQNVNHPLLAECKIQLDVKREDLIHPLVQGNKWRKLKYQLIEMQRGKSSKLITFGGAFSNHIHATAAAGKLFNIETVGILRGEDDPNNPTLNFARKSGTKLHFIPRSEYRLKSESTVVQDILNKYPNHFLSPEGGSGPLAEKGIKEMADEINKEDHNVILISAGTGCTAGYLLKHLDSTKELWVFPSLKGDFIESEILKFADKSNCSNLKIINDFTFGGYGKTNDVLIQFINDFTASTKIPVDPIYNGKLMFGFNDLVANIKIDVTKKYLWIHTGGLQGIIAYNYMADKKEKLKINQ